MRLVVAQDTQHRQQIKKEEEKWEEKKYKNTTQLYIWRASQQSYQKKQNKIKKGERKRGRKVWKIIPSVY